MNNRQKGLTFLILTLFVIAACATGPDVPVNKNSVDPGTSVTMKKDKTLKLMGNPIAVGDRLPSVALVDASTMKPVDLSNETGSVLFINTLVSLSTGV